MQLPFRYLTGGGDFLHQRFANHGIFICTNLRALHLSIYAKQITLRRMLHAFSIKRGIGDGQVVFGDVIVHQGIDVFQSHSFQKLRGELK